MSRYHPMRVVTKMRPFLGAVAVLLVSPAVLGAHAIHTTLTALTVTPAGVTLNIKAFADDFSATVAHYAGRPTPADSSASERDVTRYVRANVAIRDGAGKMATLESCGVRREAELYWLCFRAALPTGLAGTYIRNQMLTELHPDQVNIVQVDDHGARRTLLFTRTSAPSTITAGR